MWETLIFIYLKSKLFIAWVLTWTVFHYFEIQVWNAKFNFWQFILSIVIFWMLTEFSHMLIEWKFIDIVDHTNETRVIVLSIIVASLFIPFVLKKENRWKFIISLLERFWFTKTK